MVDISQRMTQDLCHCFRYDMRHIFAFHNATAATVVENTAFRVIFQQTYKSTTEAKLHFLNLPANRIV